MNKIENSNLPSRSFTLLDMVNGMLTSPAQAFEVALAAARVNVDVSSYYRRPPVNPVDFDRIPPGERASIRMQAESLTNPEIGCDPRYALYLATCTAIARGEKVERLRPAARVFPAMPCLNRA